jgi:hemerythrin-like metal-binding protein
VALFALQWFLYFGEHSMTDSLAPARDVTLAWSEDLVLDVDYMDNTHREFVDLLAATEMADDADVLARFEALIEHTVDHFGREDDWMNTTSFAASSCHSQQHDIVLQVMREGLKRGREQGDLKLVRQMAHELGIWFPQHAQTMDAALAIYLTHVGFDEKTNTVTKPEAVQQSHAEHGCGTDSCA